MSHSAYDRDFYTWTQEQAALLRAGRLDALDLAHLAEEIEDMGKEQRRAVRSQMRHLLVHLLKLRYSPARDPRPGWVEEVQSARDEIADRLADSPGLKPQVPALFEEVWPKARRQAIDSLRAYGERPLLPEQCPYTLEQALDEEFWPDDPSV